MSSNPRHPHPRREAAILMAAFLVWCAVVIAVGIAR